MYKDASFEIRQAAGYGVGSSSISSYVLIEPITVVKLDRSGRATDVIVTKRVSGQTGVLTSTEDVATQSRWVRWRKWAYQNNEGPVNSRRLYFSIPTTGEGDATNNYSETTYDYAGRRR